MNEQFSSFIREKETITYSACRRRIEPEGQKQANSVHRSFERRSNRLLGLSTKRSERTIFIVHSKEKETITYSACRRRIEPEGQKQANSVHRSFERDDHLLDWSTKNRIQRTEASGQFASFTRKRRSLTRLVDEESSLKNRSERTSFIVHSKETITYSTGPRRIESKEQK